MKKLTWKVHSWCVLATLVLIGSLSITEPTDARTSEPLGACVPPEAAVSWFAKNVDPGTLTWSGLAAFTLSERTIIESRMTHNLRNELRREHLARAAEDDRFSREQKVLIQRVRDWYGDEASGTSPAAVSAVEEEVSRLFGRTDRWLVFRTLGPTPTEYTQPVSDELDRSFFCSCRSLRDCGTGEYCAGVLCFPWFGCGWRGLLPCTGECLRSPS